MRANPGIKRFSNRSLFQPAINLRLGAYYLRALLDQWGGQWEQTLASYNAGKSRHKTLQQSIPVSARHQPETRRLLSARVARSMGRPMGADPGFLQCGQIPRERLDYLEPVPGARRICGIHSIYRNARIR